jgi:hypothetical protein
MHPATPRRFDTARWAPALGVAAALVMLLVVMALDPTSPAAGVMDLGGGLSITAEGAIQGATPPHVSQASQLDSLDFLFADHSQWQAFEARRAELAQAGR